MTKENITNDSGRGNLRSSSEELDSLLNGFAQNDLSKADVIRLCELLSDSEEARWAYIHAVHLGEGIKRWSRTQGEADIWAVVDILCQSKDPQDRELAAELEHRAMNDALLPNKFLADKHTEDSQDGGLQDGKLGLQEGTLAPKRLNQFRLDKNLLTKSRLTKSWSSRHWAGFALAASLLFALVWHGIPQLSNTLISNEENLAGIQTPASQAPANKTPYALDDSENVVARVTSVTANIIWSDGQEPLDFLMRLHPGDVVGIEKGLIELEFSDGAQLVIESPSTLLVTSAASARLLKGRVVGRAESGNFTLLTPTADVVDIGTEFGVEVGQGGTDVTVFEGEVHVHPLMGSINTGSMQKLRRGMSVRIDPQGLPNTDQQPNQQHFQRGFDQSNVSSLEENSISLLDLLSGHESTSQRIAGSIDPKTGYWGRPPWFDSQRAKAQRGDTQFAQTDWNPMVDGVFIPRSNAREMQIDSDGHMVYLPPNSGSTWGPIWARRRFELASDQALLSSTSQGDWGAGALSQVFQRLQETNNGLMGLHTNVGITFDLNAVRESRSRKLSSFKAFVANLDNSPTGNSTSADSAADLRIFVDGKLRFSRLQFSRNDGDAGINVALSNEDRFLTLVTTDTGADPTFDHVVLIDPVLEYEPPAPQPDGA